MHLMAQVLSFIICHPRSCAFLLESLLLFYFHLSFPVFFFSFHLLHCELYSELDNLIAMEACATPPRGVTTPTTSPSPSQVMSPTSWPSASSTTLQVPSPTLSRHRTRTWMTLRTCGRKKCRSISWFWCHEKHVQCSQQVF